jgi:hypothetical protein
MDLGEPTGAATEQKPQGDSSSGTTGRRWASDEELEAKLLNCSVEDFRALRTFAKLGEKWWQQFQVAFIEYGAGAADETGLAGQWGDLHRKVKKLKGFMWEGNETALTREQPEEVLLDLIGHCFLALEMLGRRSTGGRSSSPSAASSSSSQASSPSAPESLRICSDSDCYRFGQPIKRNHIHVDLGTKEPF